MSFKRKTPSRDTQPTSRLFSTGIPSLDDILGGGLPASCSLVITAPDLHTDYGELVQKYFVAQGLACGQRVCVIGDVEWVHGCMWLSAVASNDTDESRSSDEKIKIAWRYEQMKQFQTTVASPVVTGSENCHTFDLSVRIPPSVVLDAVSSNLLTIVSIASPAQVLDSLQGLLASNDAPLRICIPSFASPYWGDLNSQDILRFFHGLRRLLRRYPNACASTNLVAEASVDSGLHEKLGWVLDGAITLSAFAADPALAAAFPTLHGLVQIHALPAPRGFVPASDRFSTLRGGEAGGENNLGFKCTRKRLILETLHLDVEGGVSERRTNAPAVSGPAVTIEVEGSKKGRKKVGFQSDRPELYDF
ncbi:Elongator complex protein 4 [Mycena amicta]|nr:Elongator complex protein 4 [Mycena amicta]